MGGTLHRVIQALDDDVILYIFILRMTWSCGLIIQIVIFGHKSKEFSLRRKFFFATLKHLDN